MKTYPLKRCPFCGSKAVMTSDKKANGQEFYSVHCTWIECIGFALWTYSFMTKERAAKAWNRRKDVNS